MNRITLTRLAMAVAALTLLAATGSTPSEAAAIGPAANSAVGAQATGGVVEAGHHRHRWRHRHRHRHHGGVRFFFAPVIVGGGYYGYDRYDRSYRRSGGPSCYSICREYGGPEYCRYNWRRYC